jgi:hypothetical protein
MRTVTALLLVATAITTPASGRRPRESIDITTGRFDLDVTKSQVVRLGKSHVDAVSAFVTYTDKFFNGKTKALEIQMFTVPIDAAAWTRLLKKDEDHAELARAGLAVFVLFVDAQNRITQVNLTYVIPGTTVVRTIAWTEADIAKWFADYRYSEGRLQLKSKGAYATGADSPAESFTLSWDVSLDTPVVQRLTGRGGER